MPNTSGTSYPGLYEVGFYIFTPTRDYRIRTFGVYVPPLTSSMITNYIFNNANKIIMRDLGGPGNYVTLNANDTIEFFTGINKGPFTVVNANSFGILVAENLVDDYVRTAYIKREAYMLNAMISLAIYTGIPNIKYNNRYRYTGMPYKYLEGFLDFTVPMAGGYVSKQLSKPLLLKHGRHYWIAFRISHNNNYSLLFSNTLIKPTIFITRFDTPITFGLSSYNNGSWPSVWESHNFSYTFYNIPNVVPVVVIKE